MSVLKQYQEAVKFLEHLPLRQKVDYNKATTGRSYFLKRFAYLMQLINNPQDKLDFIHIGGTAGKGSTAKMVQSIFTAAGYKTGLFLSPHCTTTAERISIDGRLISPQKFAATLDQLKPAINLSVKKSPYGRPSYSEILNAMAFCYFADNHCDLVILEVGMGGRYDSTNIIKEPKAVIINTVGLDHMNVLGNTVAKIANEKSGVIKKGCNVFIPASQPLAALNVIRKTCQKKSASLKIIPPPSRRYELKFHGKYQQQNAALAAAVAKSLSISKKNIITGLKTAHLPCRFEIIQNKPSIIVDGAHNIDKIKSTTEALRHLTYQKLYLIIALTSQRNPEKIFKPLLKLADEIITTTVNNEEKKFFSANQLAKRLNTDKQIKSIQSPIKALDYAKTKAKKHDTILITGSFYLAGLIRKQWYDEKNILLKRQTSW